MSDNKPLQIDAEVNIDKVNDNIKEGDLKSLKRSFNEMMNKTMDAFKIKDSEKMFDTTGIKTVASKFYKAMYGVFKIDDAVDGEDIHNLASKIQTGLSSVFKNTKVIDGKGIDTTAKQVETKIGNAMYQGLRVDKHFDKRGLETMAAQVESAFKVAQKQGNTGLATQFGRLAVSVYQLKERLSELKVTSNFDKIAEQQKRLKDIEENRASVIEQLKRANTDQDKISASIEDRTKKIAGYEQKIAQLSTQIANEDIRHQKALESIDLSMRGSAGSKLSRSESENKLHDKNVDILRNQVEMAQTKLEIEKETVATEIEESQALAKTSSYFRELKNQYTKKYNAADKSLKSTLTQAKAVDDYNKEAQALKEEIRMYNQKLGLMYKQNAAREQSANLLSRYQARLKALSEESKKIREGTAQYYYRLRSIKMLNHALQQLNKGLDDFARKSITVASKATKIWFKLANPFLILANGIKKATASLKTFNKESKKTTKAHDGFVDSLKHGIWTVIKYTFGIRSLYFLFNKLRHALTDGIQNLAKQYSEVNDQMSSLLTSITMMKNSFAAMVQPLLNIVVPALEKLSKIIDVISYKIASLFALLTGQNYVYRAIRYQMDYMESLNKTKKKAKELKKELSGLDKLNVLTSHKDDDDDEDAVPQMFKKVPIDNALKDWLKKLKDFFKPLIDAWNKMKDYVIKSWKYALAQLKRLFKAVWEDFLRVWYEDAQRIFEKIFKIIGNIGLIIGNLARNILKAWRHVNKGETNGYRILKAMSKIIESIVDGIMRCTDLMVEWSDKLDFVPLFDAIADVLNEQVAPAVQKVVDLFVVLFDDVILELGRYIVEDLGPIIVKVFGNIAETIGNIALKFRQAWEKDGIGKTIIQDVERLITIVADRILVLSKRTKDWAAGLNFSPLLESAHRLLEKMEPIIQWAADTIAKLWEDVLLPIGKDFIENKLPKMMNTLSEIFGKMDMDKLRSATDALLKLIKDFWDKYGDVMLSVITQIADKIVELVNDGTIEKWLNRAVDFIDKLDPDKVAKWIIEIGKLWITLRLSSGILEKITGSLSGIWTAVNFFKQWGMLRKMKQISGEMSTIKGLIEGMNVAKTAADVGKVAGSMTSVASSAAAAGGAAATAAGEIAGETATLAGLASQSGALVDTVGYEVVGAMSASVSEMEVATATFTSMSDAALAAGGAAAAGAAAATIASVTLVKHLQEVDDAAKGGNGAISELGTGLHSLSDILLENGSITEEQAQELFKDIEQWENWGLSAEQASGKLVLALHDMGVSSDEAVSALAKVYGQNELTTDSYYTLDNALSTLTTTQKESSAEIGNAVQTNVTNYEELKTALFEVGEQMGLSEDQLIAIRDCSDEVYDSTGSMTDAYDEMIEAVRASGGDINEFIRLMNVDLPEGVRTGAGAVVDEMGTLPTYMKDGFENGWNEEFGANGEKVAEDTKFTWSGLIKSIKAVFGIESPSKVFAEIGKFLIQGLVNGIKSLTNAPINAITSVGNAVISKARSVLSPSKLVSIGKNLLSGLASGIRSGVGSALSAITSAAGNVIDAAKRKFQVHSPSKIFEDIGGMLDMGLAVGVEENTDEVKDAFSEMMPNSQFLDIFYDKFTGMLSTLREDSVDIISSMIDDIDTIIERMDNLAMLENFSTQLSNISNIKVPDIATGYKLPDNEKFTQQQTVDLSALPNMLKSAFISALDETGALQGGDGDTIIQLDGHEIFRVMKDENTKYKKQHGSSAFA